LHRGIDVCRSLALGDAAVFSKFANEIRRISKVPDERSTAIEDEKSGYVGAGKNKSALDRKFPNTFFTDKCAYFGAGVPRFLLEPLTAAAFVVVARTVNGAA
jgi:hypothetical protein